MLKPTSNLTLFKNAYAKQPISDMTLADILRTIKTGDTISGVDLKSTIARIQKLHKKSKDAYDTAKKKLPAITFSGLFTKARKLEAITKTSGLITIDIDHFETDTIKELSDKLKDDPYVFFFFKSPSWTGLKVFLYHEYSNDDEFKQVWLRAEKYFLDTYDVVIDPSGKDITRYCFLSYDPDLYLNRKAVKFDFQSGKEKSKRKSKPDSTTKSDDYYESVILNIHTQKKVESGQGRSQRLLFIGFDCFSWGIDKDRAYAIAKKINDECFDPPESDSVVEHQINSAYKYARVEFGANRNSLESQNTDKKRKQFLDTIRHALNVRDMLTDFVYISSCERVINTKTGLELTTTSQINNYLAYKCHTSLTISQILSKNLIDVCESMGFEPGMPEIIEDSSTGYKTYNRYKGLMIDAHSDRKINTKPVKVFLDHLRYLTNTDYEYNLLLNYLAYLVQNPGKKMMFTPVIVSQKTGVGKSILFTLMRNVLKPAIGTANSVEYVGTVRNTELEQVYTQFMEDRILVVVHELAQSGKWGVVDRLRDLITEDLVVIRKLHARPYTVPNTVNFLMFSNLPDALRLDGFDRRVFVIYHDRDPKPDEYYRDILGPCYENDYLDIGLYLKALDLSDFNARFRPEMTEGKKQMIEQSASELTLFLDDLRDNHDDPFGHDIVIPKDVLSYVDNFGPKNLSGRVGQKAVRMYLIQHGYKQYEINRKVGKNQIHTRVWCVTRPTDKMVADYFASDKNSMEDSIFSADSM